MATTSTTTTNNKNNNNAASWVSKRRYIAQPQQLTEHGAKPLLARKTLTTESTTSATSTSTSGDTIAAAAAAVDDDGGSSELQHDLVGISICGWDIATSQGPIGDQVWFEETAESLEMLAQYDVDDGNHPSQEDGKNNNKGRKIVLPEMVFPHAHVVVEQHSSAADHADGGAAGAAGGGPFITWDALNALREWSEAHQGIPLPKQQQQQQLQQYHTSTTGGGENGGDGEKGSSMVDHDDPTVSSLAASFRGVSVLESNDAELWKRKHSTNTNTSTSTTNPTAAAIGNTVFHYDWTYSTPFVGDMVVGSSSSSSSDNSSSNGFWQPLEQSGMDMSLLTDQSVPILYYDQIDLYEDDLHDNGFVEYGVKVRVMPRCIYVLARLFVRVDHVLVRVRDARWLIDFHQQCVFRDVMWRQSYWNQLAALQLPHQVKAWTAPTEQQQQTGRELQVFQALLSKLPLVDPRDMPSDLPLHAKWDYKN